MLRKIYIVLSLNALPTYLRTQRLSHMICTVRKN